jgi:hypothetical protein
MATNLNIDQELLREAVEMGHHKSKREAVNIALKEYVQKRKQMGIIKLFGTLDWDDEYNYKGERKLSNKRMDDQI